MKCKNDEILNNEKNAQKILSEDKLLLDENENKKDNQKFDEKQQKKYKFH